jgi:ATP-dependent helicase HrpB
VITQYPVLEVLPQLKKALENNPLVVLQAPPGAGKSTVLPLHLIEEDWLYGNKMIMLEPRRLAARSVAMRMAEELDQQVGETIGYRVRFETKVGSSTKVEVVTEGILTRMIQSDNSLDGIGLVIFDEFHERSLQSDLALALCYQVQQVLRPDLKILIMSATLDTEKISTLFNKAPVIASGGKQFPVEIKYLNAVSDHPISNIVAKAIKQATREQDGDILVFLPGVGEIMRVMDLLREENIPANIVPLFGDLNFKKQQEAILPDPNGFRKIVLATSIAETSLTIEGITTVIDCGYSRVPRFDPRSGLTRLETVRVTQDAADQRAGRAGRLAPGVCYRLWSEAILRQLQPSRKPEILEADLASLMLELANWGIKKVSDLFWITEPPEGSVKQAEELLLNLEAIAEDKITERGKAMLKLPTHPRIAHMLLSSGTQTQKKLACDIAAILEERDPLDKSAGADLSLRVEVLRKWRTGEKASADKNVLDRIEKLSAAWRKIFKLDVDNSIPSDKEIGLLIFEAYPERLAQQLDEQSERFKLANGRVAKLPSHDPLIFQKWLAIAHLDSGTGEGKIFLAAPMDVDDIKHHASESVVVKWDKEKEMITAFTEVRIGKVVLSVKPNNQYSDEQRVKTLCNAIREEGLKLLNWTEEENQWQARLMSLRRWRADENWPDVSD